MADKKQVLITGASGMVGKGVLLECLDSDSIEEIILLLRRPMDIQNTKVRQIIVNDFLDVDLKQHDLGKPDACFHCMGVSSVGMSENNFNKITFEVSSKLVDEMHRINPEMVFCYVSGTGTDSTEKGKVMWARVKGKTENYILNKGFKAAYMFRPGMIIPEKGIKSRIGWYNAIYVIMRPFFSILISMKNITTTTKIGKAMIHCMYLKEIPAHLENRDINNLSENRY